MNPLTTGQQEALCRLAERYQLDLVLLFGSRARGRQRAGSDYDVGVVDNVRPLSDQQESTLAGELCSLFRTDAVDLVMLRRTSPLLQHTTAREGVVIYEREPGVHRRYQWRACKLWEDNRRRHERRKQYVERFLTRAGMR